MAKAQMNRTFSIKNPLLAQTKFIFDMDQRSICERTDKLFAGLMLFEWLAAVIIGIWISPKTWAGIISNVHIHIWSAIILGGLIAIFPACLAILLPGKVITRQVIASGQMLMTALLIHLTGGRIETHFLIFGSLAFLTFYRDWKVLLTASLVVAIEHAIRGVWWPQSVYGVQTVEPWRWLEHTGWVVFEDIFLIILTRQSLKAAWDTAYRQSGLEKMQEIVEARVTKRTAELQREINERKETERALQKSNETLETLSKALKRSRDQAIQSSRFKSEFLANMSYEIRTPLNAIVGMSDLLNRSTHLSDEHREFSRIINGSAEVLLDLVDDILDYSKIEAGKLDLDFTEFNIAELIEGTAELVAQEARNKQLFLSTFIDPNISQIVRGDPARIRQVLLNFLSNSIKFTDRGEIVLQATLQSGSDKSCAEIKFSVSDTGIGLDDFARENVFQPFMQADDSITRKFASTGLGLAISKKLIEMMDGTVQFESTYGEGSVFAFTVRLDPGSETEQKSTSFTVPDHLHGSRILIINGPGNTQKVLQNYISSWGMSCSIANDINQVSLMLKNENSGKLPFDLILFILEPDPTNSAESLENLNDYFRTIKNKVVLIGPSVEQELGEKVLNNDFAAYFTTPVRLVNLFDCVLSLLSSSSTTTARNINVSKIDENLSNPEPRNLILVIEDNPINQKVALLQLRELGLAAHAVSSGREALEAVSHTQYTIIFMDCQMPEMDGFETTKAIRKQESKTGKHTPIIAMTANAMESDRLECLAVGMDDYISKPINQKKLTTVLEPWLTTGGSNINTNPPKHKRSSKAIEVEALRTTFGEDVAKELMQDFVANAEGLLKKLALAINDKDIGLLKENIHELKGAGASFYATEIAELSRALEESCNAEHYNWQSLTDHLNAIESAWKRAHSEIEKAIEKTR